MECSEEIINNKIMTNQIDALSWSSSGEGSDSEFCFEDLIDEDLLSEAGSIPKLQFRKTVINACWDNELCMSEVLHHKGGQLISNGILRNGKVYLSIEETLFLSEIGSLMLVDDKDGIFLLEDIYKKLAEGKGGCSLEYFKVYRYLKSLGYIVGRHGIPWSLKTVRSCSLPLEDNEAGKTVAPALLNETFLAESLNNLQIIENKPFFDVYLPNCKFRKTSPGDPVFTVSLARHQNERINSKKSLGYIVGRHGIPWSLKTVRSCSLPLEDNEAGKTVAPALLNETFLAESLNNLQIIENKPFFDVYLPNCKFRKTSPGDPVFTVSLARHHPPSIHEIEKLGGQCNGIPLKIAHVEHDRVSFFSFKHVELPTLP